MSTLNDLMAKQAQDLTNDDIDQIIIEVRKTLAMFDAGVKPKKELGEPKGLEKLMTNLIKSAQPSKPGKRRL